MMISGIWTIMFRIKSKQYYSGYLTGPENILMVMVAYVYITKKKCKFQSLKSFGIE